MLQRPWLWFIGAFIILDPLVAFLLACPSFSASCVPAALKDTVSYRIAGFIEHNDKLVIAAGTIAIAAFTYTLWRSTEKLWKAGEQQIALARSSAETTRRALEHTRTSERAYVKMSHMPPGLVFTTDGRVSVTIRVQNFGRTPATVTDVNVTPFALRTNLPLPLTPTYRGTRVFPSTRAFLVADDHIFTTQSFPLPEFQQVMVGQLRLYLFGYVDYVDAFGQWHRGGYGRMFVADQHENISCSSQTRPSTSIRQPGEGNDWNESF